MSYDLGAFAAALMGDPVLALIVVLTLGATVVNGATDAPNAIATVVGTKAMRPGPAIAMAAVCNFVGLAAITMVSSAVALTIFKMVDFGGDNQAALIALAAAMVAIIVWGVTAWYFGIPTSQSHSLIAGITGAAIALQGGLGGVNGGEWMKVIYGLVISTVLGFGTGWLFTRLIKKACRRAESATTNSFFKWAQHVSGDGVDVLPGYRRRGVAAALTSRLAAETLARGKVPFYCAAWSNIKSVRNAVKCGFVPAWAELTAKPEAFVRELNGQ